MLSTSLKSFIVLPNMSEWAVLESFLEQSLGLFAFISDDNQIHLSNYFRNTDICISNKNNPNIVSFFKNYNYSKISVCFKKSHIVSDKFIKNLKNYFQQLSNDFFKKNNNTNNILYFKISIPDIVETSIGQTITVIDNLINNNFHSSLFVIQKIYYIFNNNKLYSYLYLI